MNGKHFRVNPPKPKPEQPITSLADALIIIENLKKQKEDIKETFADWVMKLHKAKKELDELHRKYEESEEKYNKVKNNE